MISAAQLQDLAARQSPQDFWDSWANDFDLFGREVVKINVAEARKVTLGLEKNALVPLRLNAAQKLLRAPLLIDECIKILVLKARQVGSSTFCVLYFFWRCLFFPGSRIAIVAQGARSSKKILKMVAFALKALPAWLRGKCAARVSATTIMFANGSVIESGTANSEFWRGDSLDGAVLTEATSYDNLADTMAAILPACTGPVFLESTAKGMGLFKDIWDDENAGWEKVFISWLIDPACERASTTRTPTAEDAAYIAEHKLTPRQVNWYLETKWTVFAGNQKTFDQEHPATPEIAFIVAGSRFFTGRHFQVDSRLTPSTARHDWEKPIPGHKYVLGVDVAQGGEDNDASTGVLLDVTDLKDVRVASVLQCWMTTPLFSDELIAMCKDYGNVLACVESNVGLDVIRSLRKARVKQYSRQKDTTMIEQVDEYGFCTTQQSRPLLMANLTRYVMGNIIADLRDPRLKDECNTFCYDKNGKPQAVSGKRDDLVLGLALAVEAISQYSRLLTDQPKPVKPPRPVHDHMAALQWDIKYGYQAPKKPTY